MIAAFAKRYFNSAPNNIRVYVKSEVSYNATMPSEQKHLAHPHEKIAYHTTPRSAIHLANITNPPKHPRSTIPSTPPDLPIHHHILLVLIPMFDERFFHVESLTNGFPVGEINPGY